MCLRCVCVVLEALLAWRSSSIASLGSPPSLRFLGLESHPPSCFFSPLFRGFCSFYFHWASGLSVTGAIVEGAGGEGGGGAGRGGPRGWAAGW